MRRVSVYLCGAWCHGLGYTLDVLHAKSPAAHAPKLETIWRGIHWFRRFSATLPINERRPEPIALEVDAISGTMSHELMEDYLFANADALVVMVDRHPWRIEANELARARIDRWIAERGDRDPNIAFAFDRYDPAAELPIDELRARLRVGDYPWFETEVKSGIGAFNAIRAVLDRARDLRTR